MITKTKGIVLKTIKYGDASAITKIFTEENIIKLLRKSYENIVIEKDDLVNIINSKNLITGHKADNPTIQEQKHGIDFWLVNKENNQKFSIKNISFLKLIVNIFY